MDTKSKEISPLVKQLRVKVMADVVSGLDVYCTNGLSGKEFDVIAIGTHTFDDRSKAAVAFLDTPDGIKEIALRQLVVISKS